MLWLYPGRFGLPMIVVATQQCALRMAHRSEHFGHRRISSLKAFISFLFKSSSENEGSFA